MIVNYNTGHQEEAYSTLLSVQRHVFIQHEIHYLNVPTAGTFTLYDVFDYTFECLSNPLCVSVHLAASKGDNGEHWCELLSSDKYRNLTEYRGNQTSNYFAMKVEKKVFRAFHIKCTCIYYTSQKVLIKNHFLMEAGDIFCSFVIRKIWFRYVTDGEWTQSLIYYIFIFVLYCVMQTQFHWYKLHVFVLSVALFFLAMSKRRHLCSKLQTWHVWMSLPTRLYWRTLWER